MLPVVHRDLHVDAVVGAPAVEVVAEEDVLRGPGAVEEQDAAVVGPCRADLEDGRAQGASPMPPATNTTSPPLPDDTSHPVPNGPRMPSSVPGAECTRPG